MKPLNNGLLVLFVGAILAACNHAHKKQPILQASNTCSTSSAISDSQQLLQRIYKQEYFLHSTDNNGKHTAPNRAQNLRCIIDAAGFTVQPRQSTDNWQFSMVVQGIYNGQQLLYSPVEQAMPTVDSNTLLYQHKGFAIQYNNTPAG